MSLGWMVTGAGGQFGSVLLRTLVEVGEPAIGLISPAGPSPSIGDTLRVDLLDRRSVAAVVRRVSPEYIIHAAAMADARAVYDNPELGRRTNVDATVQLADLAIECRARFAFISTDLVFDGMAAPYGEDAEPTPLSLYGKTKADAEQRVLRHTGTLVIRPPLMYGLPAAERATTFVNQLRAIRDGTPLRLFEDEFRTPMALEDAARACMRAARSEVTGILHVAGPERLSRLQMGQLMAEALDACNANLIATRQRDVEFAEPRPPDVSLHCWKYADLFGEAPGQPMAEALQGIVGNLRR